MRSNKEIPSFDSVTPWGTYRPNLVVNALLSFGQKMPSSLSFLSKATRHPVKYWRNTSVDLRIWGLKMRLNPRGNISEQKLYTSPKGFDPMELRFMQQFLAQGGVFFDIGANAGVYSFWAHVCSNGRAKIISFEPDAEMRRRIDFNVAINEIETIKVLPYALSDRDGLTEFYVNEGQRGTNSLERPTEGIAKRRQIQVQMRTLLTVINEQAISNIDVMKIDIEGHEPPVLRHFFANVPKESWPRLLIGEVQHISAVDLEALVPSDHYEVVFTTKLNTIWKKRSL